MTPKKKNMIHTYELNEVTWLEQPLIRQRGEREKENIVKQIYFQAEVGILYDTEARRRGG